LFVLSLGYNNFHSGIPKGITNLTMLHVLDLSNNKLNGKIPFEFQRLQGFAINVSSQIDVGYGDQWANMCPKQFVF